MKAFLTDIQITIIFLAFGFLNYSGLDFHFFGVSFSWFVYIILVQLFVEFVLVSSKKEKK